MNAAAIGLSAIAAGQRGLDVVGQNLANSATPGYHRQEMLLADQVYDGIHGVGVQVQRIQRFEDQVLRRGILATSADGSLSQTRLGIEQQVESALSAAGLDKQLGSFFDGITQLTTQPDNLTLRRTILNTASQISTTLNQLSGTVTGLRTDAANGIVQAVSDINQLTSKIADLNQQIARVEFQKGDPNDLLNQRDQMVQNLSQKIDVRTVPQDHGVVTVIGGARMLVSGNLALPLSAAKDVSGNYVISGAGSPQPLLVQGGELGGLLREHNQFLPGYAAQLDTLATSIMQNLDQVQATGLGLNGAPTNVQGVRGVTDVTIPLNQAGLAIPVQAGQLYISVTKLATGQRTLAAINIDPTTDSLQDVAAAINTATSGQVQATVNVQNGTLQLQSSLGYSFNFAGRLPTDPDTVNMGGSSVPKVTGTYTGSGNDVFSFQVVGSGTIGVTPGLSLEVRDSSNNLINTLNVGQGYTPDSLLAVGAGISVQLSAGTTTNGTFTTRVISQPDSTGVLSGLGLNSFFVGTNAATMAVRPALLANPAALAASRSGQPGDAFNLERFAALRDASVVNGGTQTFQQFISNTVASAGTEVQSLNSRQEATQSLQSNLENQEQSLIGVDVNEETTKMLEFQRMVEIGARYLAVTNQALDSLLNIVQ